MALTGNFKIATVTFVQSFNPSKEYGFALFDDSIKEGDIVLCDSENGYDLQTSAITKCNKLASLVKYSLHAHLISFSTSEKLIALIHDVKFMALAWRKQT